MANRRQSQDLPPLNVQLADLFPNMTRPVALGDGRNPIEVSHVGTKTIVVFDHSFLSPDTTEKGNARIASTLGNKEVTPVEGAPFSLSINAYRKP